MWKPNAEAMQLQRKPPCGTVVEVFGTEKLFWGFLKLREIGSAYQCHSDSKKMNPYKILNIPSGFQIESAV